MNENAYALLGILQKYAPNGSAQQRCSEVYNSLQAQGAYDNELEKALVVLLLNGLEGDWFWSTNVPADIVANDVLFEISADIDPERYKPMTAKEAEEHLEKDKARAAKLAEQRARMEARVERARELLRELDSGDDVF
jgi:hypothetical protein